jgi:SAM-dependent methyltransferase
MLLVARMSDSSILPPANKAAGFAGPTQLPRDEEEHRRWQAANKAWWEAAPMRYDWREELIETPGTAGYFEEIDRRFLESARKFMPWRRIPFDALIPFEDLDKKDVLEIGVGHGTHAQLLAPHCRSFTGIDLTETAVTMTAKRFALFGLPGTVLQMDAERMSFAADSFDFIWSWGVIHQSADTKQVLAEIHRVLRPGGRCIAMVYYRSWWNYYASGFLRAFVRTGPKGMGLHRAVQSGTDGAIARYYKPDEWRALAGDRLIPDRMEIYGLKSDVVPLPHGRLKQAILDRIPDAFSRFLTRKLAMGSLLVAHMRKPVAAG